MIEGILIGLVIGGVVGIVAGWLMSRKHNAALEAQLADAETLIDSLNI